MYNNYSNYSGVVQLLSVTLSTVYEKRERINLWLEVVRNICIQLEF